MISNMLNINPDQGLEYLLIILIIFSALNNLI